MKKMFAFLSVAALAMMLTAAPVLAAEVDVTATNEETGADSTNRNETNVDNSGDQTVNNDAEVDNVASADVNTGDNEQEENTTGGDLTSGDVDASTDWETVVNEGFGLCGCPFGGEDQEISADFSNSVTGADSDNFNTLDVDNDGDVTVRNLADVLNRIVLDANTGDNEQEENTTAGDIETGDVSLDSTIENWVNSSDSSNGSSNGGSSSVDVNASNETTGADSNNRNTVRLNNSGSTRLVNRADISNVTRVDANTGDNEQERNTTAGSITTGNVDVKTNVTNVANSGSCCPNGGGSTNVTADVSNDTTGADSDNRNTVTVNNSGSKTVTNDATVENRVNVEANTGDNEQEENTRGGDIETGSVSIDFSASTMVNSSN